MLLLSPYDCLSHQYWRRGLAGYLERSLAARVTPVSMPPRFFSWRQRGNSLGFAFDAALDGPFDLVIATSMTDLSGLRGLHRGIRQVPAIVYFHENQFAYPDRSAQGLVERQLTSIYTALAADAVVFNSRFNRDSFLAGAGELLAKMPDGVPAGVIDQLQSKSRVIPVALEEDAPVRAGDAAGSCRRIAWNHRWEYDKGPARLLAIIEALLEQGASFEMSLLGQRYREVPRELQQVVELLAAHGSLYRNEFIEDRRDYLGCLAGHDIALSTADQEFQGLAVQEAMLCGCMPVVPDALVYPDYVPDANRYSSVGQAVSLLAGELSPPLPADLAQWRWAVVGPAWQDLVGQVMSR